MVTFQENLWVVEGLGIGMKSRRSPSNLQAMGMLVGLGGQTHLEGSMNLNGTGFLNLTMDFRTWCLWIPEGEIFCVLEVFNQPSTMCTGKDSRSMFAMHLSLGSCWIMHFRKTRKRKAHSWNSKSHTEKCLKWVLREFPGDPVVKTLLSLPRALGSIPGLGTKIPQAVLWPPTHTHTKRVLRQKCPQIL